MARIKGIFVAGIAVQAHLHDRFNFGSYYIAIRWINDENAVTIQRNVSVLAYSA